MIREAWRAIVRAFDYEKPQPLVQPRSLYQPPTWSYGPLDSAENVRFLKANDPGRPKPTRLETRAKAKAAPRKKKAKRG